ncbi:hypothetical protein [Fusobacterium ulcerans]|uniref:hypothetical protein n=1 Tax=Fusobacterium ulcerans TaxID=861 RepID=UPI0026F0401C|nr:hypothetical protein [Fusobacterium ulcerans]
MPKRIFKAGNYGTKGNYTIDKLKSWIGKEFCITAGHVGDWKNAGYPITAIPVAGNCKATGVDEEGYLLGEFAYNSFGNEIKDKYPNLSLGVGVNGEPNHIAILGYAPPHLKDLDKSFSEFSIDLTGAEEVKTIEFAEEGGKTAQQIVDEMVGLINKLDLNEPINFNALQDAIWEKSDLKRTVEKLKSEGYTVEKTAEFSETTLKSIADTLGMILSPKKVTELTPEQIYAKAKAEFTREAEKEDVRKKMITLFPPVMHKILEFAIDKAYEEQEYNNIIEFSETEKVSMAVKMKEFSTEDSPFKKLFENITENKEFSKEEYDPIADAKQTAEIGGI